jgi:exodeoxyribonuclease VII large subunit
VSEFVHLANSALENSLSSAVIEGEIANFKVNQNKFVFFDLKDGAASVSCFMTVWRMRLPLADGMRVVAKVQPKITDWGKFSLTIQQIKPQGEGDLKKSFELLKKKLASEGLFAPERKRILPSRPQKIAVISSTQAAGYADFIKILNERWGGLKIQVAHTQVQGAPAADQIIRALDFLNSQEELPEVIAIIRGGGSADDLAVFNDEQLVRAVANSRVPVITGIGHETDEVLADLAADFVASTPSNVAQILTPDKHTEIEILRSRLVRTERTIRAKIMEMREIQQEKLTEIYTEILRQIDEKRREVQAKKRLLASLNPERVLAKGYAILRGEIAIGQELQIETSEKIITAEVKNVRSK